MATGDNVDVVIWSIIECYTAIICACLASIRPLIAKIIPTLFPTTKGTRSKSRNPSRNPSSSRIWQATLSGRLRSGQNATELYSDDDDEMAVDGRSEVGTKATVVDADIELRGRVWQFTQDDKE